MFGQIIATFCPNSNGKKEHVDPLPTQMLLYRKVSKTEKRVLLTVMVSISNQLFFSTILTAQGSPEKRLLMILLSLSRSWQEYIEQ